MDESKQKLVEDNMALVYHIIWTYYPNLIKDEDTVQIGMVGLCQAAHYWDESKGVKFSTYAALAILNTIRKEFRDSSKQRELESMSISLGMPITRDDDMTLEDTLTDEDYIDWFNTDVEWSEFVSTLTEREREVIELRTKGLSRREIAEIMSVSTQMVGNYLRQIMYKWRNCYGNH